MLQVKGITTWLVFCLLMLALDGCKSEEPFVYVCRDGLVDLKEVTDLRYFQSTIDPKDSLATVVIRNNGDYKKYIADRIEDIDFSKETLLASRVINAMPGRVISQKVTNVCASNSLIYDVKIRVNSEGITARAETPFFVVIPKIPETTKVIFNIHF